MMGRWKPFSPNNKLVQEPEEMKKTDIQIQNPTKQGETIPRNPMKATRTL
jgi:hypothetical protein